MDETEAQLLAWAPRRHSTAVVHLFGKEEIAGSIPAAGSILDTSTATWFNRGMDHIPILEFEGGFRFLSNFYPVSIMLEGNVYLSAEHAFQAAKTADPLEQQKIREMLTPGKAKRAGRQVTLRPNWEQNKLRVMEALVRQKFNHPDLRDKLLATGNKILVEGNTWGDTFWGVCRGKGENHLGKILMKVRSELAALVQR